MANRLRGVMKFQSSDLLFSERLAPITTSMGFIESDISSVVEKFIGWQRNLQADRDSKSSLEVTEVAGDLESVLRTILPFKKIQSNRFLFIPTDSQWTAYIGNRYRGTDPSAIRYMSKLIGCRSLWMTAIPHTLQDRGVPRIGRQGALIFELYGPEDKDVSNMIRSIRLENNAGKWEFTAEGNPQPFEEPKKYRAEKISDRFSFDLLSQYLNSLGIFPFSSDYYMPAGAGPARLVELRRSRRRLTGNVSFKRARRLNKIEEGLRFRGRLISRGGYF